MFDRQDAGIEEYLHPSELVGLDWTVAVYGRLNVNVALNRPTFMSSVRNHGLYGYYQGSRAVDGNKDPVALKVDNSCAITDEGGENPWWAVDLGVAVAVLGVLYTNRGEGYGIAKPTY